MNVKTLQEAFELFSGQTAALEASYRSLRQEFSRLSERLSKSSRTLEIIIAHMSEGLIFIGSDGTILRFNAAAGGLLELTPEEVQGKPVSLFFPDSFFGFSLKNALESQSLHSLALLSLQRASTRKELEVSATFIPEEGLLLLLRDVTEIKHLTSTVSHHDRLRELGEMAASLAHEIRNPLGGIEGFADLLKQDLKDQPKQQAMAIHIVEGSRLLNRLVSDVLQYAKPVSCRLKKTALKRLCEETVQLVASAHKKARIELIATDLSATVDPDLIKSALINLLQNSLEAHSPGVTVRLYQEGIHACLAVEDAGEGILPELLPKIFTPFFTTKVKGTGLGLAEVQKVIDAHGGKLLVDSTPGKGSKFTMQVVLDGH